MLCSSRILGACGVVAIAVFLVGSALSAGDVSRLSLAESSDLWGAGGGCTGSKVETDEDGNAVFNGCSTSPCTAVQNTVEDTGSGAKITPYECYYTSGGRQIGCGAASLAESCAK